jgi:hypothetical protein
VNATFTGFHEHDAVLPDWSRAARAAETDDLRSLRESLEALTTSDDATVRLDASLAAANIDVRIAEFESGHFHDRNPALWTGEAIFGAVSLMIRPFAPVTERLPALASRLDAVPGFLAAMRDVIRGPVPATWTERARKECRAAIQLFESGLAMWFTEQKLTPDPRVVTSATAARLAFAECESWLATVEPAPDGATSAGPALMATLLERGHFARESASDLLAQALNELPEQQRRLDEMVAPLAGSWTELATMLAADHPSVDDYLGRFESQWQACRANAARHDAVEWQDWPIRYAPMPAWAREAAPQLYWLFYRSPAALDPYSVYDYLVTPIGDTLSETEQERRLRAWNSSTITLNHVVHHGAIGHHVQNWHARFRSQSRVGAIAAADCASRIGMFLGGSMAVGWACYATDLMDELGFLTPLERVSEQHTRVRMLARAIVDLRLHTGACTFGEAVAFYERVVGMSPEVAAAETAKNSMFPCTALMYWLGTRSIFSLRKEMKRRRGAAFTLRTFHDELLSRGAIPVALAARLITGEIA